MSNKSFYIIFKFESREEKL